MRLQFISYPLMDMAQGEPSRDYLIANHIVSFHEWPLTGPWNGLFGNFLNSPSYYYLAALFLLFRNSIVFLVLINVLLQVITGMLLYILASKLFSKSAGIIAAALFLFSNENLFLHSRYFWQPYVMQPVLILAFLLLYTSFQNRNIQWFLGSIFVFIAAMSLHMSVLGILPIFLVAAAISLKNIQAHKKYLFVILAIVGSLFLFYYPVLLSGINLDVLTNIFSSIRWPQFKLVLLKMAEVFFGYINFSSVVAIILTVLLLAHSLIWGESSVRVKLGLLALGISTFLIILASVNIPHRHYLTPIFGPTILLLAGVIDYSFSGLPRVLKWIVAGGFLILISNNLSFLYFSSPKSSDFIMEQAVNAVAREVAASSLSKQLDPSSFLVVAYAQESEILASMHPAFLIAPLENHFKLPLSRISTIFQSGYSLSNNSDKVFLLCRGLKLANENICTTQFYKDHPDYRIEKKIFSAYPLLIFTAKR